MVTNKQISDSIETGVSDAQAQGIRPWQGATDALISLFIENGECFSSGEIAAHLRTFRPDLQFSVTSSVGSHVRDRFYGNTMPLYPDGQGGFMPVEMVPRTTQGIGRTPAGIEVFVYGPNTVSCQSHGFEVDIPAPGTQVPADPGDANGLPARPVQTPASTPKPGGAVNLRPRAPLVKLVAVIHADGRMCIPRSCLEALLHASGASLKGGDPVYVAVSSTEAVVALDTFQGSRAYSIWASTGRVYIPRPADPFRPGDAYSVTVDAAGRRLVMDLTKTV